MTFCSKIPTQHTNTTLFTRQWDAQQYCYFIRVRFKHSITIIYWHCRLEVWNRKVVLSLILLSIHDFIKNMIKGIIKSRLCSTKSCSYRRVWSWYLKEWKDMLIIHPSIAYIRGVTPLIIRVNKMYTIQDKIADIGRYSSQSCWNWYSWAR